jgi:nitrogen-specific signal transduction histidine kinase/DNA-binding NarL/FixJ family response regulator
LFVEDNPDDADLLLAELRRAGFDPEWKRVQTEGDFLAEIKNSPDIVLSDYSMPNFGGLRAAKLLSESGRNIPFILISGTVGEEVAVEAMKHGATDYLLKDRIVRLGKAVTQALEQRQLHEERQQTQAELLWKTALLEAQVDSALDAILVVNDCAKKILQNQRLYLLFKVPDHIIRDDDDAKLFKHIAQQIKDPEKFAERVTFLYAHPNEVGRDEIEMADGTILDRYSSPVRDKEGKYYGRIWTFRDISESRKLETQYRQAQKMEALGQLSAGIAHDFNNLLTAIHGNASLLTDPDLEPEKRHEFIEEIIHAAESAAELTRQLLLFSRKQAMRPASLDLNTSVNHATKMLRRTLGEDITLNAEYTPVIPRILADAGMIEQIIFNLAVNARDAMINGGKLTIRTSAVETRNPAANDSTQPLPHVSLAFHDTGCGIAPENLPHIFEPFFTTKEVGKGTGLGLATVYGIIEQHNGWITVESEAGRGTTFQIYFPALAAAAVVAPDEPSIGNLPCGKETILVVEDELPVRSTVCHLLQRLGYTVLQAQDGFQAFDLWQKNRDQIHLLLTDLVMPNGMSGHELAARIHAVDPAMKIIFTSGYAGEAAVRHAALFEGENFIRKPFKPETLAEVLRKNLDGKISGP